MYIKLRIYISILSPKKKSDYSLSSRDYSFPSLPNGNGGVDIGNLLSYI